MSQATSAHPPVELSADERAELLAALSAPLPSIPSRYLYDDHGSALFEQITDLPEYYQTRTERQILETEADRILEATNAVHLGELGSGAGRKIGLLVEAAQRREACRSLTLLDINASFLQQSVRSLQQRYPDVDVRGVVGRFTQDLDRFGEGGRRLIAFFGSTIGNFHPSQIVPFLRRLADITGPTDSLLVGFDLVKDVRILEAAYNDSAGVTAAFNLNILRVFNRATGADFDPDAFEHVAFYDPDNRWIEMRLRATRPVRATVPAISWVRDFDVGDELRTEVSCKYDQRFVQAYAEAAGLHLSAWFTDPDQLFALAVLRREVT